MRSNYEVVFSDDNDTVDLIEITGTKNQNKRLK
jgi:hypothetical protein